MSTANELSQPQVLTTSVVNKLSRDEARAWDAFVASVGQSDVSQLYAWSRVRESVGFSSTYAMVRAGGELVAGAQVLARRFPLVGSVGYVPCGPLIADNARDRDAAGKAVCRAVAEIGRSMRALFVQPSNGAEVAPRELARYGFRPSEAGIAPSASLRIDLRAPEDELRSNLDRRLQKWTRQWPKRGVTVRTGDDADLPLLAELLSQSARHHGFKPMSLEYLRRKYCKLAPEGHCVIFVGEVHSQPIAVSFMTCSGGMIRERLVGLDRESEGANLSVPSAITWNAILWAREHGLGWYDLGGLPPQLARELLTGEIDPETIPGPDRYKLKFGGEPYLMPQAMEFGRPRVLMTVYDIVRRSKSGRVALTEVGRRLRGGQAAVVGSALCHAAVVDGTWAFAAV